MSSGKDNSGPRPKPHAAKLPLTESLKYLLEEKKVSKRVTFDLTEYTYEEKHDDDLEDKPPSTSKWKKYSSMACYSVITKYT